MFHRNLTAVIASPVFIFCVIISFFIMLMGDIGLWIEPMQTNGLQAFSLLDHFSESFCLFGYILTALPLLTSVPTGFCFCDEKENGILQQRLVRQGILKYSLKMTAVAASSGFLIIFFSECLFFLFFIIVPEGKIYFTDNIGMYSSATGIFSKMLSSGNGIWIYLFHNFVCCIYGMIWPVFGLAASAWGRGRCIAVVVPFMLWCLLDHLTSILSWFFPLNKWYLWSLDISNITLFYSLKEHGIAGIFYACSYSFLCIFIGMTIFIKGIHRMRITGIHK